MSTSRILRGIGALHCDLAGFFFGGLCDYRQFLIWWRLSSFVMIIAEFWPVIGCKRSMASDSPPAVWRGQTVFSLLNEASPLSIHPCYPYSLLSLSPSGVSSSIWKSIYLFFPISADNVFFQVLKIPSCRLTATHS